MDTRNRHLARDLEQAMAKTAMLQQQRADMVKAVARSPQKPKPKTVASKPKQTDAPIAIQAYRPSQHKSSTIPARQPQQRDRIKASHKPRINDAKRPNNNNTKPSIARDDPSKTAQPRQQQKQQQMRQSTSSTHTTTTTNTNTHQIVPLLNNKPTIDMNNIKASSSPFSPKFLTSKTRNMHCELDDPGVKVPYPRHHPPRRGFFQRLLSCFAPPPPTTNVFPGQPPSHMVMATPPPRIASAKVTPPMLQLRSEMEPLRQSLASLKPGLMSDAVADVNKEMARDVVSTPSANGLDINVDIIMPCDNDDEAIRRRALARTVAAEVAANPPTPRFGGMPAAYKSSNSHGGVYNDDQEERKYDGCLIEPEVSFESTTAEVSDAELTPEIVSKQQSKRVQLQHPAPAISQLDAVASKRQKHNDYYSKHMAAKAAAKSNFVVSHSDDNEQRHHANKEHAKALESALLKAIANKPVPLPPNRVHQNGAGVKKTGISVAGLVNNDTKNTSYAAQHVKRATAQPYSAPASPRQQRQKNNKAPAMRNNSNDSSNNSATGITARPQQQQQQQRGGVQSAPVSRCASPLKAPSIQPRMNKAAAARSEATQRLLNNRRQREAQQWAALPEAVKLSAIRKQSGEQQQVDNDAHCEGFTLPPAGSGRLDGIDRNAAVEAHDVITVQDDEIDAINQQQQRRALLVAQSIKHIDVSNIPFGLERGVASIDYKQMLEHLASGKSYDEHVAKVVTKPSVVNIPIKEGECLSDERRAPSSCNSTTSNNVVGQRRGAVNKQGSTKPAVPSSRNKENLLDRIVNVESSLTIEDLDALKQVLKQNKSLIG